MKFILIFIVLYFSNINCNHYFARTGNINRYYEHAKLASAKKAADKKILTLEQGNEVSELRNISKESKNVYVNISSILLDDEIDVTYDNETRTSRKSRSSLNDVYRFSLTSSNPAYKVLSLEQTETDKILYISTYISFRDKMGYPFVQTKTADSVYFYKETFIKFFEFLYEPIIELNINTENVCYKITKHADSTQNKLLTILMQIATAPALDNSTDPCSFSSYIYRGISLSLTEYQYLLSRASQILKDMG